MFDWRRNSAVASASSRGSWGTSGADSRADDRGRNNARAGAGASTTAGTRSRARPRAATRASARSGSRAGAGAGATAASDLLHGGRSLRRRKRAGDDASGWGRADGASLSHNGEVLRNVVDGHGLAGSRARLGDRVGSSRHAFLAAAPGLVDGRVGGHHASTSATGACTRGVHTGACGVAAGRAGAGAVIDVGSHRDHTVVRGGRSSSAGRGSGRRASRGGGGSGLLRKSSGREGGGEGQSGELHFAGG
jgi:hypothetical protein